MTATDKARRRQHAKGNVEEAAGNITDNDRLRTKDKADQMKGNLKEAGEKGKDAFNKWASAVRSTRRRNIGLTT